ncbi:MAG TPA: response regulator [Terriglobales bacterium]|nr:response regulator [Terriglobales bacterium]
MTDLRQIGDGKKADERRPIRVLLLDDLQDNLFLRSAILRQHGYHVVPTSSVEEALAQLHDIDIAVLDYQLGAGTFGTEVAESLREKRPEVPIIIMSAVLERRFGGIADMHLLKGYSSVNDLLTALRAFEAKRRGKPVVVHARDFYYNRIALAVGSDVVLEILDRDGNFEYVNDLFASFFGRKRAWFTGRNLFEQFPELGDSWRELIRTVAETHETYIDRGFRGLPQLPTKNSRWTWNVLVFPIKLHDGNDGVMLTARMIEKRGL